MKTSDPRRMKKLGREVKHFCPKIWGQECQEIVFRGNVEKFKQNPKMLRQLLDTGDRELVEASPYDKIWGIGLRETDPRAQNKQSWKGQNLLGKILVKVREELRGFKVEIEEDAECEEEFDKLMKKKVDELKDMARSFPRDLKNFGGWSGKNKEDLVRWILRRQAS